jgi:hypothetical protein
MKRFVTGLEDKPEEEKKPTTPEGIARLMKQREERKEEIAVATLL